MKRDDKLAIAYGLVVACGFAVVDAAVGSRAAISGSYALGAIVAGVLGGFQPAAAVGVVALLLSGSSGAWNHDFGSAGYFLRLVVSFAGCFIALGAGRIRDENDAQLARQQLLGAVADLPEPGATLRQTVSRVVELLVPRYAAFAAVEGGLSGEQVRLGAAGVEPIRDLIETRLSARGRDIGALQLAHARGGVADAEFLRVLAGRIALALDNAGLSQELVTVEQQLDAILENLGEAVTVQDQTGRLVFANSAAAEMLGAESVEDLLATPPSELVERYTALNEDGTPFDAATLPGRIVLAGGTAEPLVLRARNNATGEERWRVTKSTAVRNQSGEVLLAVNVIEDVTDSKRAEMAQRLLADASSVLASSLDYERTLQRVVELAVPRLAEACSIWLPRGDLLEEVAVARADPDASGHVSADTVAEVLQTGRPHLSASRVVVPMVTAERTIGVLALASGESRGRYSAADVDLALELGRRAATAIDNSRLYSQLTYVATTLQRSLLPPSLPEVPGWQFECLYLPAGGETEVGGDFYDVFPTAAGWMAVMGDVVGRGPAAASLTTMGRYTLRTAGSLVGTPTLGLARLNDNLRERGDMALCTAAVLLLRDDSNEASLVSAGHPLPFLVRGGEARQVGRTGPLLGAFEHGPWLPSPLDLEPGDVVVLYTDGVLDARGSGGRFGEERLADTLAGAATAREAVARIRAALQEFAGGEQDDDTAVLALQKV